MIIRLILLALFVFGCANQHVADKSSPSSQKPAPAKTLELPPAAPSTESDDGRVRAKIPPRWIKDDTSGCQLWDDAPMPEKAVTWSGGCFRGRAQGEGVLQWYLVGKKANRYEGQVKNGTPHGKGILFTETTRFEGGFKNGKLHGWGRFIRGPKGQFPGLEYEGEFTLGRVHGRGVLIYGPDSRAPGDRYEGGFGYNRRTGGLYTHADGSQYYGPYVNRRRHGVGKCRKRGGIWHECEHRAGLRVR